MSTPQWRVAKLIRDGGKRAFAWKRSGLSLTDPNAFLGGNDEEINEQHARNKLETAGNVLALQYKMTQHGYFDRFGSVVFPQRKLVTFEGAKLQLLQGTLDDYTEAAHCIPAQYLVHGIPVQDFAPVDEPLLAAYLRGQYGRTDIVSKDANKVDSALELKGYKEWMRRALQEVTDLNPVEGGKIDVLQLQMSYERMHAKLVDTHREVIEAKEKGLSRKDLSGSQRASLERQVETGYDYERVVMDYFPESLERHRLEHLDRVFEEERARKS